MSSRVYALAAAATVTAATALSLAVPAQAASGGYFAGATNALRGSRGLPAYRTCDDLNAVASRWAASMAARHTLGHNPSLAGQVAGWSTLGENVGTASSASGVERALEASPGHLANLDSRSYTEAGFGTATSRDGQLWVDEVFRRPAGGGCGAAAAPLRPAPGSHPPAPVSHSPAPSGHRPAPAASRGATRAPLPPAQHATGTAPRSAAAAPARVPARPAAAARAASVQQRTAAQVASMDGAVRARLRTGGPPAQDVVAAALSFARMMRPVG